MTDTHADALARLLDGDPTLNGEATAETRALGQLAHVLATTPVYPCPEPRPEFKADLRAALVDAARDQAPAPSALSRLRTGLQTTTARWRHSRRLAAATGAAALALSSGGMSVAAERALPSDALYPAKLALEDVRIALVRDEVRRGDAHLAQAVDRIAEAEAAVAADDQAGAARALLGADESARTGAGELIRAYQEHGDARYVAQLEAFADEQAARVEQFDGLLAGEAADAGRALSIGLERIEARMAALVGRCPACGGVAPTVREGADLSEIPPAHEPFEACPCEVAPEGRAEPSEPDADPSEPEAEPEPAPPADDTAEEPTADDAPPPALDGEAPPVEPTVPRQPVDEEPVPEPPEPPSEAEEAPDGLLDLRDAWRRWRSSEDGPTLR